MFGTWARRLSYVHSSLLEVQSFRLRNLALVSPRGHCQRMNSSDLCYDKLIEKERKTLGRPH